MRRIMWRVTLSFVGGSVAEVVVLAAEDASIDRLERVALKSPELREHGETVVVRALPCEGNVFVLDN